MNMRILASKAEIKAVYIELFDKTSLRDPNESKANNVSGHILELELTKRNLRDFRDYWSKTGEKPFTFVDIRNWVSKNRDKHPLIGPSDALCKRNICDGTRIVMVVDKSLPQSQIEACHENMNKGRGMLCVCHQGDSKGIEQLPFAPGLDELNSLLEKDKKEISYDYIEYVDMIKRIRSGNCNEREFVQIDLNKLKSEFELFK